MTAQPDAMYRRRRFTVAEYEHMGRAGVLDDAGRVELLNGEVVMMSPIGPLHAGVVKRLARLFNQELGNRAIVSVQDPITLTPFSEPEPDIAIVRDRADTYTLSHPVAPDVFLIVEVAESSLTEDRALKVPIYADAGIIEVWVVDVINKIIYVHRQLKDGEYAEQQELRASDVLSPAAFPDLVVQLTDLFR